MSPSSLHQLIIMSVLDTPIRWSFRYRHTQYSLCLKTPRPRVAAGRGRPSYTEWVSGFRKVQSVPVLHRHTHSSLYPSSTQPIVLMSVIDTPHRQHVRHRHTKTSTCPLSTHPIITMTDDSTAACGRASECVDVLHRHTQSSLSASSTHQIINMPVIDKLQKIIMSNNSTAARSRRWSTSVLHAVGFRLSSPSYTQWVSRFTVRPTRGGFHDLEQLHDMSVLHRHTQSSSNTSSTHQIVNMSVIDTPKHHYV